MLKFDDIYDIKWESVNQCVGLGGRELRCGKEIVDVERKVKMLKGTSKITLPEKGTSLNKEGPSPCHSDLTPPCFRPVFTTLPSSEMKYTDSFKVLFKLKRTFVSDFIYLCIEILFWIVV